MSEEIKETLDDIKRHLDYVEATKQSSIRDNEMKTMYEYITSLQQKVEQLENENEYLKMSNPEQNMEHFRIVNENKRKIDMLRKENHQLENIRKEAIKFILQNCEIIRHEKENVDEVGRVNGANLLNILNKGSDKE